MNQLYKFRKLDKNAIDILVNRRLYLSSWEILNDPHEAKMLVSQGPGINYHMNPNALKQYGIKVESCCARVCSLSATWSSNLLWSHYAAGQAGIAIGMELPDHPPGIEFIEIKYDDSIPTVDPPIDRKAILRALSHKSKEWKYEKEVRLVSFETKNNYVEGIKITDVIFGLRSTKDDIELVKNVTRENPVAFWKICHKPGTYQLNRGQV